MPFIQINKKSVHVLQMNPTSSKAILMVHGLFTNLSVFYFNIALELSKHFRVVLYDLKSHGRSEFVNDGYDLTTLSNELIALMNSLHISKADLIGYSYGGLISLKTTMLFSERINKLVVIESPRPDRTHYTDMLKDYKDNLLNRDIEAYTKSTHLKPGNKTIEKVKSLYKYLVDSTTIMNDMMIDSNFFNLISDDPVKNETLLLYGRLSDCMDAGEYLHKAIPTSKFSIGEGDHNIPVQNPSWLSQEIIKFLL